MWYNGEKQQVLVSSLTNVGALVGDNSVINAANGIKGLDVVSEQAKCNEKAKAVYDGLFKVTIIGAVASGKSTVRNALLGRRILPEEAALPCTAVLTFIQSGTDTDVVEVVMADEQQEDGSIKAGERRIMPVEDFKKEYKYTNEDDVEFKETGSVKRFAAVKYAIVHCKLPLMEGGVSIIDSPGLEDKSIATNLALDIAENSQAIIYVLTGKGMASSDREYVLPYLSDNVRSLPIFRNCPNNVFFLINMFDQVRPEEREGVLKKVKDDLAPVFTEPDGSINEELRDRRVFGISALRALEARMGEYYDSALQRDMILDEEGKKRMLEISNFVTFENELETFLTTDEKCVAQYQNCFAQMASSYREAEKKIQEYISCYENNIELDAREKEECVEQINRIVNQIEITERTFDNCSLKIQNAFAGLMDGCSSSIDMSWERDMEDLAGKVDIGIVEYMWNGFKSMNPLASKESKQEQMREFAGKFVDVVAAYFVERIEKYISDNRRVVDAVVEECQRALNADMGKTNSLLGELSGALTKRPGGEQEVDGKDSNWLQIMISAVIGDYSKMIQGEVAGKSPWIDYIRRTIVNSVWQTMLVSLVDGGIGVLLVLAIELIHPKYGKNRVVKDMLNVSKNGIIRTIQQNALDIKEKINNKIASDINEKKEERCSDDKRKLDDERNRMANIEQFYKDDILTLESERVRFDRILEEIFNEAKASYKIMFGMELDIDTFKRFLIKPNL